MNDFDIEILKGNTKPEDLIVGDRPINSCTFLTSELKRVPFSDSDILKVLDSLIDFSVENSSFTREEVVGILLDDLKTTAYQMDIE